MNVCLFQGERVAKRDENIKSYKWIDLEWRY